MIRLPTGLVPLVAAWGLQSALHSGLVWLQADQPTSALTAHVVLSMLTLVLVLAALATVHLSFAPRAISQSSQTEELQIFIRLPSGQLVTFVGPVDATVGSVFDFIASTTLFHLDNSRIWRLVARGGDTLLQRSTVLNRVSGRSASRASRVCETQRV